MGNVFDSFSNKSDPFLESTDKESSFSKREIECIKKTFGIVKLANKTEVGTDIITPQMIPSLRSKLIRRGSLANIDIFIQFLEDTMRSNADDSIESIWNLISDGDKMSSDSKAGWKFRLFFELLIMLVIDDSHHQLTSGMNEVIDLLVQSVLSISEVEETRKHSQEKVSIDELKVLKIWSQRVCPRVSKVFETYLTELCFPLEKNPSFYPYRIPNFIGSYNTSDILPNGNIDLFPLSLYHESLQGKYHRLYSTSSDGLSFNRMAHHIMGYEVRFSDYDITFIMIQLLF